MRNSESGWIKAVCPCVDSFTQVECSINPVSYTHLECVQLYLSHTIQKAKLSPKWSLKGFKRVHMAAGETRRLIFTLTAHELRSVEEDGSRTVESGAYTLYLSGGQPDARTRDLTGIEPVRYDIVLL